MIWIIQTFTGSIWIDWGKARHATKELAATALQVQRSLYPGREFRLHQRT